MSEFVEVKTDDLNGRALDWAVAKACGTPIKIDHQGWVRELPDKCAAWRPSWNWSQGGPLIESQKIELSWGGSDGKAFWWEAVHPDASPFRLGDTPLIAACRAIVAAKLGETVSVPKELLPC